MGCKVAELPIAAREAYLTGQLPTEALLKLKKMNSEIDERQT
jgi:hypothetical protein